MEEDFLKWYSNIAKKSGINSNPDHPKHYYDYRSAFKAGADIDSKMHLPSEFKHDLHPDRYIIDKKDLSIHDSKYNKPAKFEDLIIQSFKRKEYESELWR